MPEVRSLKLFEKKKEGGGREGKPTSKKRPRKREGGREGQFPKGGRDGSPDLIRAPLGPEQMRTCMKALMGNPRIQRPPPSVIARRPLMPYIGTDPLLLRAERKRRKKEGKEKKEKLTREKVIPPLHTRKNPLASHSLYS